MDTPPGAATAGANRVLDSSGVALFMLDEVPWVSSDADFLWALL
jgi:hypothetical protein